MAQLLALEWDGEEARVAIGTRTAERTTVDQAFRIPLHPDAPVDIGRQIGDALRARKIGAMDAVVCVGRGSVELRQLHLPPAADEELPQMVQLRALMEFNELNESWSLDFVPIETSGEGGGGPRTILAAAVSPELIDRTRKICRSCNLKVKQILFRPCAAAALLSREGGERAKGVALLVESFSDRVDLTVTAGGRLLFVRSTQLGSGPLSASKLCSEIRLTLNAVENQLPGLKAARIVLCDPGEQGDAWIGQIEKETSLGAELFDPFAGMELGVELQGRPIEQRGRFAAVLGMLSSETGRAASAIDFLNPRRAIVRAEPRNKWKIAGVAAAIALAAYFAHGRIAYWRLEGDVHQLENRLAEADKILKAAGEKNLAAVKEISKWTDGEIHCLDQFRDLSKDFPPAEKASLTHMTLTSGAASASGRIFGKLQLEGRAADNQAVSKMEEGLRTHGRRVEGTKTSPDESAPPYKLKFSTTVLVDGEAKR